MSYGKINKLLLLFFLTYIYIKKYFLIKLWNCTVILWNCNITITNRDTVLSFEVEDIRKNMVLKKNKDKQDEV